MDQEQLEKQVLENRKLIKENQKLLKRIDSRGRMASFMRSIRLVIIIVVSFGIYSYLQPIFSSVISTYNSITETIGVTKDLIESPLDFLKNI